jgi:hypothetical protein
VLKKLVIANIIIILLSFGKASAELHEGYALKKLENLSFVTSIEQRNLSSTGEINIELSAKHLSSLWIKYNESQIEVLALRKKQKNQGQFIWLNSYEEEQRMEPTKASEKEVYFASIDYFLSQIDRMLLISNIDKNELLKFKQSLSAFITSKTKLNLCAFAL